MPSRSKRPDIQAFTMTPRERVYADVDARFEGVDIDLVRRVKSVAEAPAEYLPYLAWERSVDVYDPEWSEAIKRAVIEAAPEVHRYKGTRYAVEVSLAALQVRADIVEWWQTTPKGAPYTFEVRAYAGARLYDGPVLDTRLVRVVYAAVDRAKPLSRAFKLTIGANFPETLGLAPVALGKVCVRRAARPRLSIEASQTLGLAAVALARIVVRRSVLLRST